MDEQSIFLRALEISNAAQRAAWLDEACRGDQVLKRHILGLLERQHECQGGLEKPPAKFDAAVTQNVAGDNLAEVLDAGLAPAFGRDQAVIVGRAGHSVLKMLGQTIDLPRVVLRESTTEGVERIVRAKSPDMANRDSDSRYQLHGEIARGGMGAIIKGRDTDLGRDLAIKVLLEEHKAKPEVIQRFIEEAQIGGQLQHPGIAPIYELGQFSDKRPFFSMKLVKGETLSKLLANRNDSAEDRGRFLGIFEQVCQTMAYAHSRGVIHRDLKPANIMVGAFGEVQVMDWGLAKVLPAGGVADERKAIQKQQGQSFIQTLRSKFGSDAPGVVGSIGSQTQMGSVMGTPAYMPPEQALGEIDNLDERADVFGLGAILCEILTGQPPYVADDGTQVFRMASRGKLSDCFERLGNCGADDDLIQLAKHCLNLEPAERPRDAGVLAERISAYLESVETKLRQAELSRVAESARAEEALHTAREHAAAARAERHARKLQLSLATGVVVVLIVGGIAAAWTAITQRHLKQQAMRAERDAMGERELADQARRLESEQRQRAEREEVLAKSAMRQAESERIRSLNMLADMQTERGLLAAREGHSATAALWFANAALLTPHDSERQRANRLRASSWLNEAMAPAALLEFPDEDVRRFEFQPKGALLLTVSGITLRVWDWQNDEVLPWSERLPDVADAAWSPDGKQLAVECGTAEVRIVDPTTGRQLKQFHHTERVECIAWSPDGRRLALGGLRVQIWNVEGEPVLESDWPHPQKVFAVKFNRAGTRLVTACDAKLAHVFAVADPSLPAPLYAPVHHAPMTNVMAGTAVFFDEDRKLVTIDEQSNQPVLRDAATGDPLKPGWGRLGQYAVHRGVVVSPDGRWVVAAGNVSAFLLGADGRSVELKHSNHVDTPCFTPDAQSLVTTCFDGMLRWWPLRDMSSDAPTVGVPLMIPQIGTIMRCELSSDGSSLAIYGSRKLVVWRRLQRKSQVGQIAWRDGEWRPRISLDGRLATPGIWHGHPWRLLPRGDTLSVVTVADGKPAGAPAKLKGVLCDSCLLADNRTVVAVTVDGSTGHAAAYDIASGSSVMPTLDLPEVPACVAARPGRSEFAVLCQNGKLLIIDSSDGRVRRELDHEGWSQRTEKNTTRVAYSPDGATLLTVAPNDRVYVRNSQTGELRFPALRPVLEGGPLRSIAFSRDSRWFATAVNGRNMAQVWDLASGEKSGKEMPHPGDLYGLYSVAFSPDGQQIITGHKDGRVRVWDWRSAELVGAPMQHLDEVSDAQFTADGRYILSLAKREGVVVWDTPTRKVAVPYPMDISERASSFILGGERAVVGTSAGYFVLDLSVLHEKSAEDMASLLRRAELASTQKNQHGEFVSLDPAEWSARWEQRPHAASTDDSASLEEEAERSVEMKEWQTAIAAYSQLITRKPKDSRWLAKRAHVYIASNRLELAKADLRLALEHAPYRMCESLANQLVELVLAPNLAEWTVLKPIEMKSASGATLVLLEDGSILVSGANPGQDQYTLVARPTLGSIRAIRLEALPHPSLPHQGPGRAEHFGNFHLNEISVTSGGDPVSLTAISTIYDQLDEASRAIDGKVDDAVGWSNYPRNGQANTAVMATEFQRDAQGDLRLDLHFSRNAYPQHSLGCFRLSVSGEPLAFDRERKRLAALNITDPWAKLAVAYQMMGDEPALARLLQEHPEAAVGFADVNAGLKDWEAAISGYSQLITSNNPDTTLLMKRARAYIASKQWELAKADCLRSVQLRRSLISTAYEQFRLAGRWSEALEIAEKSFEDTPNESLLWLQLAPVAALAGDETYRDYCHRCAQQFRGTADVVVADRVIKSCLIKPGAIELDKLPGDVLAEGLDTNTAPGGFRSYLWFARALLAYRSGDAESAVKHATKSEALKPATDAHLLNFGVFALAQHALGNTQKCQDALEELSKLIAQQHQAHQLVNHDVLIAEMLLQEAAAKVNGSNKPKPQ